MLLGGGHAHLQVLARFAERRPRGWDALLVTPHPRQIYSGMLPGWIAGHYTLDEISIDLLPLARAAEVGLLLDAATGLDADAGVLHTRHHGSIAFDALSIDVGSGPPHTIPGAAEHGVGIRPIEGFAAAWERLRRQLHDTRGPLHVVVLGAGPGGVELAFGLRHRAIREGWSHLRVRLVGSEATPLPGAPASARTCMADKLREVGVEWEGSRRAAAIESRRIVFEDTGEAAADVCWIVTGAAPVPWLAASGLDTDDAGYVRVNGKLQSLSHANVFAAGDAASHPRPLPKSGVYAVRAGAALARSLLAFCEGMPLTEWRPQRQALYLVSTGDRHAVAVWARWSWQGSWTWRWKDLIDRRFVEGFRQSV
ncbi:NADH dehydrogenase-like protein [Ramlibacter tataouinensis TTB310]|uniref:NADH dehydrogenase-like protein n=1 Tax=Ramlibacter tataouinensis (strain ATCC BAA-407 / DSM 14655 / LMG 21543 / TTB310) TaxID=365046 RepID=F5Y5W7_RAMTT|nr:NADH dehydrogenase-like protein [Ramlibacter tataouinensis TTB310]